MYFVVHDFLTLPISGRTFTRGMVLRGSYATEFANAAASDATLANKATRTDYDPEA
jgi:hypothetical protein